MKGVEKKHGPSMYVVDLSQIKSSYTNSGPLMLVMVSSGLKMEYRCYNIIDYIFFVYNIVGGTT